MDETKGYKVLVIDPEWQLIEAYLAHYLNDEVRVALDGREGLTAAEQDPPDLIILGLVLPDLHGYEVYRRLRMIPALQHVPVLFQSADTQRRVYPEAQRLGAAGYLRKPYRLPEELLAARDAALRGDTYYPTLPAALLKSWWTRIVVWFEHSWCRTIMSLFRIWWNYSLEFSIKATQLLVQFELYRRSTRRARRRAGRIDTGKAIELEARFRELIGPNLREFWIEGYKQPPEIMHLMGIWSVLLFFSGRWGDPNEPSSILPITK